MINTTPQTLTADELAAMMRLSIDAFRKQEKKIGLHKCRVKLSTRPQQYRAEPSLSLLRAFGFCN